MVDTVNTVVIHNGSRLYVQRMTNISDGTGETAVIKVNLSDLIGPDGSAPTYSSIQEIEWTIQGMTSVALYWDHTTDDLIDVLTGIGYKNYTSVGGLVDPRTTGGTGDIVLTTTGAVNTGSYDITLVTKLKD